MRVLFSNSDWLAVDKPSGLSTHGAWAGDLGVVEWLALHCDENVLVCSRLDKGTSGVLLLARHAAASGEAQRIHEAETARKEYVFLSHRSSQEPGGPGGAWVRTDAIDGAAASTSFRLLGERGRGVYAYGATLARGRKHQVRRHAAASGIPLLGDVDYGGFKAPRLFLHCLRVEWPGLPPLESMEPSAFFVANLSSVEARAVSVAIDRRSPFLEGTLTNAFRCVHRGEFPGEDMAVDCYGNHLVVWHYDETSPLPEITRRIQAPLEGLAHRLNARGWVFKRNGRNPHKRGLVAEQVVHGEPPPGKFWVEEHGLRYLVTLTAAQHVGLFLDQRDNRARIRRWAQGARVANLFSYTCSFSVAAARGNAEVAMSVDIARPCLEIGKENFALNGLTESGKGKFVQEDARAWLARQKRRVLAGGPQPLVSAQTRSLHWDLIVCDPPVFAQTAGSSFSVETAWQALATDCAALLEPTRGTALFCNNHRGGELAPYRAALHDVFEDVEVLANPLDFPTDDEGRTAVKMFLCRRPKGL